MFRALRLKTEADFHENASNYQVITKLRLCARERYHSRTKIEANMAVNVQLQRVHEDVRRIRRKNLMLKPKDLLRNSELYYPHAEMA